MQASQPVMLDLQLYPPGRIGLNKIHELPGNYLGGQLLHQPLDCVLRHNSLEQPTHSSAGAYINLSNLQFEAASITMLLAQIDIIYSHYLAAMNINYLLIEQVAFQQEELFRFVHLRPAIRVTGAAEE